MIYEIRWSDEALAAAATFMADDPQGLAAVFDAVDRLTEDPRSAGAFAWGGTALLRLRVGRYRVIYEIEDDRVLIGVVHLGRGT